MRRAKIPPWLLLATFCWLSAACSSHSVALIDPKSGATVNCSAMGGGLGAFWVQSYIQNCIRDYESSGYVKNDELTPEQRADLEKRGLLLRE